MYVCIHTYILHSLSTLTLCTGCLQNIMFFKVFKTHSNSVSISVCTGLRGFPSLSVCIHAMAARWQSSEKLQHLEENIQHLMNTLYVLYILYILCIDFLLKLINPR